MEASQERRKWVERESASGFAPVVPKRDLEVGSERSSEGGQVGNRPGA